MTVTVLAGDTEEPVVVHKDIVCRRSNYFVAACSKAWAEDGKKPIRLDSVDADTFSLFIGWAYTGKIDNDIANVHGAPKVVNTAVDSAMIDEAVRRLTRLYIAADMLLTSQLRRDVVDQILQRNIHPRLTDAVAVKYVWEHTLADAALRRLLVDVYAAQMQEGMFRRLRPVFCEEFLLDLACRLLDGAKPKLPGYGDRCHYHDHASELERHVCGQGSAKATCPPGSSMTHCSTSPFFSAQQTRYPSNGRPW